MVRKLMKNSAGTLKIGTVVNPKKWVLGSLASSVDFMVAVPPRLKKWPPEISKCRRKYQNCHRECQNCRRETQNGRQNSKTPFLILKHREIWSKEFIKTIKLTVLLLISRFKKLLSNFAANISILKTSQVICLQYLDLKIYRAKLLPMNLDQKGH